MRLSRDFRMPRERFLNAESVCGTGGGRSTLGLAHSRMADDTNRSHDKGRGRGEEDR